MRYSKTHKEETRRKLLDSSRALVKKGGFDTTGVEALMSSVGLTPGAFYAHFASKRALLEEVLREEMQYSLTMFFPEEDDGADGDALRQRIRAYLSSAHALHPEVGCVLPALGAELGRTPPQAKTIIEAGLKKIHGIAQTPLKGSDTAWAVLAQCVGAMILARAVASEGTRKEILRANRAHLDVLLDMLSKVKAT